MGLLRIMDETGDTNVKWNANHEEEVAIAKKNFESAMKNGMEAWAIDKNGEKSKKITKFDPLAEEILIMPKPVGGPDLASESAMGAAYQP